jgi:hypothetical protein
MPPLRIVVRGLQRGQGSELAVGVQAGGPKREARNLRTLIVSRASKIVVRGLQRGQARNLRLVCRLAVPSVRRNLRTLIVSRASKIVVRGLQRGQGAEPAVGVQAGGSKRERGICVR